MDEEQILEIALKQLDRVLTQFARVESRLAPIFAIDLGMLSLLVLNLPHELKVANALLLVAPAVLLIGVSVYYLYKCAFPQLEGGQGSMYYFSEIAQRTEQNYASEFKDNDIEVHTNDVLGQVWRNSQILAEKFQCLRKALNFLLWGFLVWSATVGYCVLDNARFFIK